MDTNFITPFGLDIDALYLRGTGTQTFNLHDTAGVDIGSKYLKGSGSITTGFSAGGTDIGYLLETDAVSIRRTKGIWYSQVGGQNEHEAAWKAGFALLEDYSSKMSDFIDCPATEKTGSDIAYRRTVWNAFRIYSAFADRAAYFDIKFTTTDGGNGTVVWSGLRDVSDREKWFVISGGGGDKGHYGEGVIEATIRVPGIKTLSYKGTFWIYSD